MQVDESLRALLDHIAGELAQEYVRLMEAAAEEETSGRREGEDRPPYYMARTAIDTLALIDTPRDPSGPGGGSNSLRSWR